MASDMDVMLAKIKDRQWALVDIDWDAPGAEMISDEQRPQLKAFMADLCWIENMRARGFAPLEQKRRGVAEGGEGRSGRRPSRRPPPTPAQRNSGTPTPNWH